MGQFLSNKYIKYRNAIRGGPIKGDHPCDQCSYNLRGLRFGGACPECGTPITLRENTDLPFYEMPLPVIKRFRVSAWAATISMVGFFSLLIFSVKLASTQVPVGLLMLIMITIWIFSIWNLTPSLDLPQAERHGFSPKSKLRFAARWMQFGWVLTVFAIFLIMAGARTGIFWYFSVFLFFGGILVGLLGIAALSFFLGRFADWVRDDFAEKAFKLTIWGNIIAIPLSIILPPLVLGSGGFMVVLVPLLLLPIALLLISSLLAFPIGLISLSRSVDWSIVHSREKATRARVLREKMVPRPAPLPEIPEQIELSQEQTNPERICPLSSTDPFTRENT